MINIFMAVYSAVMVVASVVAFIWLRHPAFIVIGLVALWLGYVNYGFWRDNRLDEEDEKLDRIRGEHA